MFSLGAAEANQLRQRPVHDERHGSDWPGYIIQGSTNLIDWMNLHTNTQASVPFVYTDTNAGSSGTAFTGRYWIREQ